MEDIKKLDDNLHYFRYHLKNKEETLKLLDKIKNNVEIQKEAIKVIRDKWDERDTLAYISIVDAMLVDYNNVDKDVYNELVNIIYTNTDIARIVIDGASNGGFSFLLMTLWNENLILTEEQKAFAVNEAMNKIGTTKYQKESEAFDKKLKEKGITEDITTTIELGGHINPIDIKTMCKYFGYLSTITSESQAHGVYPFDIRYWILRNHNWSLEEKQKLIMEFWYNDEEYDECLEEWEWSIINDRANYKEGKMPPFDKDELINEIPCEYLLKFYGDEKTAKRIWEEIEFCKQMHKLRPMEYEKEYILTKEK